MTIPYLKGAARHAYNFPTKAQCTKLAMVKVASQTSYLLCPPLLWILPTSFWHSFWHIFEHLFWHPFPDIHSEFPSDISCDILSDISSAILSDKFSDTLLEFRRGTLLSQDRGWGPARNTDLTGSQLRSDAERWTHSIAVEVRHITLNSHGRKRVWRITLNSHGRKRGTKRWRRTRTQRRRRRRTRNRNRRRRRTSADIKSNNPHLTGGEKPCLLNLSKNPWRLHVLRAWP